ncbi:MAG TPA: DUF1501 domain-containing protein [Gemmataceae bacterium]|nr:DUF1501 domain-containing protein [Gemmataceae bacterium]
MLNRRQFIARTLAGSSLLAVGSVVPEFVANTARAAEAGKETVLVVIEMTGGNDGLGTVIPYADDLYHKARPTLRQTKEQVVKINDHIGLNSGMRSFEPMLKEGHLAVVQGVGYPNPDRSHFESMDVWQSGDPRRAVTTGWVARSVPDLQDKKGNVPVIQIGDKRLPLALQGAPGGVASINNQVPYRLEMGTNDPARQKAKLRLIQDLAKPAEAAGRDDLLQFVRGRQLQTYFTLDQLTDLLKTQNPGAGQFFSQASGQFYQAGSLPVKLNLIAQMIQRNFGTRVFYVALDGFDTHSGQAETQRKLLAELADGISNFFNALKQSKNDSRVLVMTFSEFGRRVQENGSRGTDHGAASCLFVAGPAVKGGPVGKHPSLSDLDAGDLKHHTDFRQLYATLLDQWLGCDSKAVLGGSFAHLDLLKAKA